jgi:preprotein translocase subunit SecA
MAEASAYYERRESDLGAELMREVERQVMLRIIDQRWREHLYEMDYLMEGINLRAMGQQDPLVAWQQDGFKMFGEMMHGIAQDFVRYVMHVQVVQQDQAPAPVVQNVQTHSAEDVPQGASAMQQAAVGVIDDSERAAVAAAAPAEPAPMQPVVLDEWSKTPRNAPCPCGSGKKFKMCHGK